MTCKDCIHYDRCKHLISKWGINLDKGINTCDDFKDKSTTLDLPCKVGDTVYYIYPIMHSIREDRCFVKQIIVDEISLDINGIRIFDELGIDHDLERIYFTKEEAEKALEGLK